MAVPEGAGNVNHQEERSETLFATSLPMLSTAPCDRPGSGWQLGFGETAEGRCFAALLFVTARTGREGSEDPTSPISGKNKSTPCRRGGRWPRPHN